MIGIPKHISDHIQISGRGGRDGEKSISILYYARKDIKKYASDSVKAFLADSQGECKHTLILKEFENELSELQKFTEPDFCCDTCLLSNGEMETMQKPIEFALSKMLSLNCQGIFLLIQLCLY